MRGRACAVVTGGPLRGGGSKGVAGTFKKKRTPQAGIPAVPHPEAITESLLLVCLS